MKSELSYPYAKTKEEEVLFADDAEKGPTYYCLGCGTEMNLRKGTKRRPYFAHMHQPEDCTNESVLHATAKRLIKSYIENNDKYEFSWNCKVCHHQHTGNLVKEGPEVLLEKEFSGKRPDLLLMVREKPQIVIEVVVSHYPKTDTINVFKDNGIFILVVRPTWESLDSLKASLGEIEFLNAPCTAPRCSKCKSLLSDHELGVYSGYPCYRCKKPMDILVEAEGCCDNWRVTENEKLVKFADSRGIKMGKGINARDQYSSYNLRRCFMHICKSCGLKQQILYINEAVRFGEVDHIGDYTECESCSYIQIREWS